MFNQNQPGHTGLQGLQGGGGQIYPVGLQIQAGAAVTPPVTVESQLAAIETCLTRAFGAADKAETISNRLLGSPNAKSEGAQIAPVPNGIVARLEEITQRLNRALHQIESQHARIDRAIGG